MVRIVLMKRNPKLIGSDDFENLVVQTLKDEAIWVACKNFDIYQHSFNHPSFPFVHDKTEIDE